MDTQLLEACQSEHPNVLDIIREHLGAGTQHARVNTSVSYIRDIDTQVLEAEQGRACQSEHPDVLDTKCGHSGLGSRVGESTP